MNGGLPKYLVTDVMSAANSISSRFFTNYIDNARRKAMTTKVGKHTEKKGSKFVHVDNPVERYGAAFDMDVFCDWLVQHGELQ